jgi:hypothetical protein
MQRSRFRLFHPCDVKALGIDKSDPIRQCLEIITVKIVSFFGAAAVYLGNGIKKSVDYWKNAV